MNKETEQKLKAIIRDVPDFPIPGILFRDLTTLFKDAESFKLMNKELVDLYRDKGVTKVVGIESRGFIAGSALANEIGAGFVLLRKPGKLPAETVKLEYSKEYGTDVIEIHKDAITSDDVVVIHDDLLATGGTMAAAYNLVKMFNPKKIYVNFLVELSDLKGRELFNDDVEVSSLIVY